MADPSSRTFADGPSDSVYLFRQQWQQGAPPDLVPFLASVRHLTPNRLVEILRIEQQGRWRRGERIEAEAWLDRFPTVRNNPEDALVLIYGEVLLRSELGEKPDLVEYQQRFPQYAAQLALQFALHEALGPPSGLSGQAGASPSRRDTDAPTEPEVDGAPQERWPDIQGYEILGVLGLGGMGVVYRARDRQLGRKVAIKMVKGASEVGPVELVRFQQEAEVVARLQHSNIVQIYEVGNCEGRSYIVLELVDGPSLAQLCGGLPQPPREAAQFIVEVARAIHYAHSLGIVHRDLKPGNILMHVADLQWYSDGTEPREPKRRDLSGFRHEPGKDVHSTSLILRAAIPKITDFGLARRIEMDSGLTQTGAIIGTPSYMAPEQATGGGDRIGPVTDVYSLGAILYELLTGRPPFRAATAIDTIMQVRTEDPVPPRRLQSKVPRDLETITLKCLYKDPVRRYASAEALAEDLCRYLSDQPILARPAGPIEHGWRWCRRNPRTAALLGLVASLLLTLTVGSLIAAVWLQQVHVQLEAALKETAEGRKQADAARLSAELRLWAVLLERARASRLSRQPGQYFRALDSIREALALPVPRSRARDELRHEALAALVLPDLEPDRELALPARVTVVALDPAFERLAAADDRGTVHIRRLTDHKEMHHAPVGGRILALDFSPDGQTLHALAEEKGKRYGQLWRLEGSAARLVKQEEWNALTFSPDGKEAAATRGDTICTYDTRSGEKQKEFQTGATQLGLIAWNPKKNLLAVTTPQRVLLFENCTAPPVWDFDLPRGVSALDWHPQGKLLAVGGDERKIYLLDTERRQPARPPLMGHRADKLHLRFNWSGDRLLSNDGSGLWRLWDVRTGQQLLTQPGTGTCLLFRNDDALVAGDLKDGKLRLFRFRRGSEVVSLRPWPGPGGRGLHPDATPLLAPDGRLLVVPMRSGLCLVDVLLAETFAPLQFPGLLPLGWEPDGSLLTISRPAGDVDKPEKLEVLRWPASKAADGTRRLGPPVPLQDQAKAAPPLLRTAVSADGKLQALVDSGGLLLRHIEREQDLGRLAPPEPTRLLPCCFTPDGRRLVAVGTESNHLHIFDLYSLRRQLGDLGLDWDQPPLRPAIVETRPLRVEWVTK